MLGINSMKIPAKENLNDDRENRNNTALEKVYEVNINAQMIKMINLKKNPVNMY